MHSRKTFVRPRRSFGSIAAELALRSCASLVIAMLGCAHSEPSRRPASVDLDERAANVWQALLASDPIQLGRDFDPRVDKAFPKGARALFIDGVQRKFGKPIEFRIPRRRKNYEATYLMRFEKGELELRLSANEKFVIIGFTIVPPKSPALARNVTPMDFPLEGPSLVLWGDDGPGSTTGDVDMQRYAFDLLGVDALGRVRVGSGQRNEDYSCFGRRVYAPASGTVVEAVDGLRDNRPGDPNPYAPLGNAVMIQHAPNETSVLAHLARGSVKVKAGQHVHRGQVIAQCGNSGNSGEPHLRFHVQDQSVFQKGAGVKAYFERIRRLNNVQLSDDAPSRVIMSSAGSSSAGALADYAPSRGDVVEFVGAARGAPGRSRIGSKPSREIGK